MSITNFTRGPWRAEESPRIYGDSTRIMAGGERIALVPPDRTIEIEDGAIAEELSQAAKANAKLIASVPDLYAALDAMLDAYEEEGAIDFSVRQKARAALNRAEGRTP